MDYTVILIGAGIIAALFIIGKIFAILTRMLIIIILVAIVTAGVFLWFNTHSENPTGQHTGTSQEIIVS